MYTTVFARFPPLSIKLRVICKPAYFSIFQSAKLKRLNHFWKMFEAFFLSKCKPQHFNSSTSSIWLNGVHYTLILMFSVLLFKRGKKKKCDTQNETLFLTTKEYWPYYWYLRVEINSSHFLKL